MEHELDAELGEYQLAAESEFAFGVPPQPQLSGRGSPPVPSFKSFSSIEELLQGGWLATASLNLQHLSYILADFRSLAEETTEPNAKAELHALIARLRVHSIQHQRLLDELRAALTKAEAEAMPSFYQYALTRSLESSRGSLQSSTRLQRARSMEAKQSKQPLPRHMPVVQSNSLPDVRAKTRRSARAVVARITRVDSARSDSARFSFESRRSRR